MNNQTPEVMTEFLQVFMDSVTKTLFKRLDADIYKTIKFSYDSILQNQAIEDLKSDKLLYKIDFALETRQGNLAILIPEDLIANIADSITGGKGVDAYTGKLSELELNSVSSILENIFRDIEVSFKSQYEKDFIFSSTPTVVLKEQSEYVINEKSKNFDYVIGSTLVLNEGLEYKIEIVSSSDLIEKLLKDLGFTKTSVAARKKEPSSIDFECLSDVKINVTAELGRTRVPIKYALELVRGSLIELDTQNNADIKVYANGVEFAYAQVVAIGESFGLKITKIISPEERLNII